MSVNENRHTYIPAFDGLRGIAILPVILLHVGSVSLPNGPLLAQLSRGWYGVDLFFVLSGFLITWILDSEIHATGTVNLWRFYERRILRLAPAYFVTLIVLLCAAAILRRPELELLTHVAPSLVTYTYNYQLALGGSHFDILVVVWSLCVEEQFYLFWPWVLRRLGRRRALGFCIAATIALSCYRTLLYGWFNWGHLLAPSTISANRIYFSTDTRVGVIFVGCALALSMRDERMERLWQRIRESRLFPYLAFAVACLSIAFITGGRPSSASWRSATFGYTLGAMTTGAVVAAVFVQPRSIVARALSWNPLVSLGRVSYGAYLFHLAVARVVVGCLHPNLWQTAAARLSSPALGPALPVSQATVVPLTGEMGRMAAAIEADPLVRFGVAAFVVVVLTVTIASLHYEHVERRFMALRRAVPGRADLPGR